MKNTCLSLLLICSTYAAIAQTDGISYQAVLVSEEAVEVPGVDITSAYLAETEVTIRFTILDQDGSTEYQETQQTVTDPYGMINVVIGQGEQTGDSPMAFDQIDWDGTPRDLMVELAYDGAGLTLFSQQPLLFVPYAFHRNITATGTLTVDGATALHSTLTVDGVTDLNSTLFVDGGAYMNNSLDVDGPLTVLSPSQFNGQVTIDAGTSGGQSSYSAYGLRVEGTGQGVAVKLNGTAQGSGNFLTFMDGSGTVKGCIEGQTLAELHNSFRFIWDVAMGGFAEAFVVAEGVACGTQLDVAEAGVMVANAVVAGAQWVELTYDAESNVGVSFVSGGADYAEWLERGDPAERFTPGDVVGVRNGKISKHTDGAQQVLVISTLPIVLGNQPAEGKEDRYERVAFLGQVPVKVIGPVNEGDYLVPSGFDDGMAMAFAPEELPTERFGRIIGIAWEKGTNPAVNTVNAAIGLNANDVAQRVSALEKEVSGMRKELAAIKQQLNGGGPAMEQAAQAVPSIRDSTAKQLPAHWTSPSPQIEMTDAEFEAWLEKVGQVFTTYMGSVRDQFKARDIDYARYPDVAMLVDDPLKALRAMHDGNFMPSFWKAMEARHKLK